MVDSFQELRLIRASRGLASILGSSYILVRVVLKADIQRLKLVMNIARTAWPAVEVEILQVSTFSHGIRAEQPISTH